MGTWQQVKQWRRHMKIKNVKRSTMIFALSASFVIPHSPQVAFANRVAPTAFGISLFSDDDTGVKPANPTIPKPRPTTPTTSTGSSSSIKPATVSNEYKCPLFDNRPHDELIKAIDALSASVTSSAQCTGSPSAKTLDQNGQKIKESINDLKKIIDSKDSSAVDISQIDASISTALTAAEGIGEIINNNSFLNSSCGRQTMSSGKVLLALNDIVNGLAPYALFAVSMNSALAPALPFIIGGTVATSGISAISKMIEKNTLDMKKPEHRKALLQNTCQYTKIAKKVRFMQLAQSGKIDKITQELEKSMDFYNTKLSKPSRELVSLLQYRDTAVKARSSIEGQLLKDRSDLAAIEKHITEADDNFLVCTLSNELVNWAQDGKSFPSSVFINLQNATAQSDTAIKLQAASLTSLHTRSMERIAAYATSASQNEASLRMCAQAGRSWMAGIRQSISITSNVLFSSKIELEDELSRNNEYRRWKTQYAHIETQKTTIQRVEKAMQELSKDTSIIDRSELAQRMNILKAGLFGSRKTWNFGNPPVLAWINHTKAMHDQAIAGFSAGMEEVRRGSYSLTDAGRGKHIRYSAMGTPYTDAKVQAESTKIASTLANLNLKTLPIGSREHEIVCQSLEAAWIDWSASLDHIGAIQFFCDMIDPVLDIKMDVDVIRTCRGYSELNGTTYKKSMVLAAKDTLIKKGFQRDANLVSTKLKTLQCPMPSVSVMNE